MINSVKIEGVLTRDPEVDNFDSGRRIRFGITNKETIKPKNKEEFEKNHFIDCESWFQEVVDGVSELKKGDFISVEGSLQFDSWEEKATGTKRSKIKVKVSRFQEVAAKKTAPKKVEKKKSSSQDEIPF